MQQIQWDKRFIQLSAFRLLDDERFASVFMNPAVDEPSKRLLHMLRLWAQSGAQSVVLPNSLAAALASTSVGDALDGAKLPWTAFEIPIPPGLVPTEAGDVTSVFVGDLSQGWKSKLWQGANERRIFTACYVAGPYCAFVTAESVAELLSPDDISQFDDYVIDDALPDTSLARERRIWTVLKQLVAGVVLTVEQCRAETPAAYAPRALRVKRERVNPNAFVIGKPLKLDCRNDVREYVLGRKRSAPRVCTIVRGHWVRQPHGPGQSLRRVQWRKPHPRGHGSMLVRPVSIGAADA